MVISVPNAQSLHASSRALTDPLVRATKRALGVPTAALARRDRIPPIPGLEEIVANAGLELTTVRHVAALVIPAPLDRLMPATSERLGVTFERRHRVRRVLATQVLLSAVK